MKNKGLIVILITYFMARIISGLTGVYYNPFGDKFDFMLLIKDLTIWTLSYVVVSLSISKLSKSKGN